MLGSFSVILQGLDTRRLLVRTDQRQIANLQQLRRGKEHHVHRIVEDRIAQAAFVDDKRPHSRAFRFDGRRQAGWASANANHVIFRHKNFSLPGVLRICKRTAAAHCVDASSKMEVSSRRKLSNSFRRSGVASISLFFHTKTSPLPRFSFTLRFPSTMYVGAASKRSPALATGASSAAHSPRRTQSAVSYGGIAIGRNPASNSRSSVFICCGVNSGMESSQLQLPGGAAIFGCAPANASVK